ncbi:MAG: SO_0444 family Cu/Zn efflux transporter [Spirochaetes bacterium]|nr:SO_0444 family Cu/Zn efflux transporter [Spirochaetota bacterium]
MEIILNILKESWLLTIEMAPYLMFGFLVAGILHVFIPIEMIGKHLGRESISSVIKASLIGIPIPLCSCGVLPVAAGIRKSGASRSSTLSFLITTPVTGIDSLMATYALLGWIFFIVRIITAAFIGFVSGFAVILFSKNNGSAKINGLSTLPIADNCCDSACSVPGTNSAVPQTVKTTLLNRLKESLHYSFIELPASFSGSLLFGLILAGIITYILPPEIIKQYFGPGFLGVLVAALVGIPLYVCSTGSIPIAAAMIASGFSPGAALSFLIAGPATNTVAILTVRKILGNKETLIYLVSIFIGAIGFGLLFDQFNINMGGVIIPGHEHHHISLFKIISGIILLLIIVSHFLKNKYNKYFNKIRTEGAADMNTMIISSPDISCNHCANTIKKTLQKFGEIEDIKVDVNSKNVSVTVKDGAMLDKNKILSALEDAGYPSTIK